MASDYGIKLSNTNNGEVFSTTGRNLKLLDIINIPVNDTRIYTREYKEFKNKNRKLLVMTWPIDEVVNRWIWPSLQFSLNRSYIINKHQRFLDKFESPDFYKIDTEFYSNSNYPDLAFFERGQTNAARIGYCYKPPTYIEYPGDTTPTRPPVCIEGTPNEDFRTNSGIVEFWNNVPWGEVGNERLKASYYLLHVFAYTGN